MMKLGKIVIELDRDAELQDIWSEILSNLLPVVMVFLIALVGVILVISFIINPVLEFIRTVQRQGATQPVTKRGAAYIDSKRGRVGCDLTKPVKGFGLKGMC